MLLAADARQQIQAVTQDIDSIDDVNHAVANATQEQNTVSQSLDSDIMLISDLSGQGQQNLQATLAECQQLQRQFDELEAMVLRFKV